MISDTLSAERQLQCRVEHYNSLYVTFRCDDNLISIVLDVSASEVEPAAVVAPLLHLNDPKKKGQKSECKRPKRKPPPKPETPPMAKVREKRPQQRSWCYDSPQYDATSSSHTTETMSQPRKVHLFNCDQLYKLDVVEDLLEATKAKVGLYSSERHYFCLSKMSEMTTKTIPKLDMDLAFFVVFAHESRLSINEDNAGIGYAKIYRALLNATGKRAGGSTLSIAFLISCRILRADTITHVLQHCAQSNNLFNTYLCFGSAIDDDNAMGMKQR